MNSIAEIRHFVSAGNIKEAIKLLRKSFEHSNHANQIRLLSGRYEKYMSDNNSGTISYSESKIELNQINSTVLDLCDRLNEKSYKEQLIHLLNEVNPEIIQQLKEGKPHLRVYIHQDNFNELIGLQESHPHEKPIVLAREVGKSVTITPSKLRKTMYIYDLKYGFALDCWISNNDKLLRSLDE